MVFFMGGAIPWSYGQTPSDTAPSAAQPETTARGMIPPPEPLPSLVQLRRAIVQNNTRAATELLARLEALATGRPNPYFPELAAALWEAAHQAEARNDRLIAEQCRQLAIRLDASNPVYRLSMARRAFTQGPRHWRQAAVYTVQAFWHMRDRPGGTHMLLHLVLEWIGWIGVILCAGMGFLLMVRWLPVYLHDMAERWNGVRRGWFGWSLGLLILIAVYASTGALWGLVWTGILLSGYASRVRRVVILGVPIALIGIIALAYLSYATVYRYTTMPRPWFYLYAHYGDSPFMIHRLYAYLQAHPDDRDALLLYGHILMKRNRLQDAETLYRTGLQYHPDDPGILNNLGNVYHHMRLYFQAMNMYTRAEQHASNNPMLRATILYNQGRTLQAQLEFRSGEQKIGEAMEIYPELADRVAREETVLDVVPPAELAFLPGSPSITEQALHWIRADRRIWMIVLFFGFWGIGMAIRLWRYRARECSRCQSPYCPDCIGVEPARPYCSQCLQVFVRRTSVAPERKDEKLRQIVRREHFRVLIITLLDLIIPGGGRWSFEERSRAGLRMFAWAVAISILFVPSMVSPWLMTGNLLPVFTLTGIAALFLIYIYNLIRVIIQR